MQKVNDMIAEDGFTISVGDEVMIDGVWMHCVELWDDGTMFVCDEDGGMVETNIDEVE